MPSCRTLLQVPPPCSEPARAWLPAADIAEPCHVLASTTSHPLQSWAPTQALSDGAWSRLTNCLGKSEQSHRRVSLEVVFSRPRRTSVGHSYVSGRALGVTLLCQVLLSVHCNGSSYLTRRSTVAGPWVSLTRVAWQHQPSNKG